jgi:CO dehydrogenase maturation factor
VVVDCTAGADSFASGLFTRFDLTVLVAEPTRKGISAYRQWQDYSAGYHTALALVGNKVQGPQDTAFLRAQPGDVLLAWLGHEPTVRAMEQGRPFGLDDLSGIRRDYRGSNHRVRKPGEDIRHFAGSDGAGTTSARDDCPA